MNMLKIYTGDYDITQGKKIKRSIAQKVEKTAQIQLMFSSVVHYFYVSIVR